VLIALASLVWVPVDVWIGLRPGIADRAQAIVQFKAAFARQSFSSRLRHPDITYHLNVEIWVSPR